jgi:hypothetical protein
VCLTENKIPSKVRPGPNERLKILLLWSETSSVLNNLSRTKTTVGDDMFPKFWSTS